MKISRDDKKAEAIRRMELLGVYPETIEQFDKYGYVSISEPPMGAFFWAQDDDLKAINEFEHEYNALVYMVVRSYFKELGKMDAYFYVSDYIDEWKIDVDCFKNNEAFVYVFNHDYPMFSEFGSIGIKRTPAAGFVRVW